MTLSKNDVLVEKIEKSEFAAVKWLKSFLNKF